MTPMLVVFFLLLCLLSPSLVWSEGDYSVQCPKSNTPPLILRGKRFYDSVTGSYVAIRGIAYYPRPNDGPLSIPNSVDMYTEEFRDRWEEDLEYLKSLNVNAIRLYAVDPSKNHDAFFCALQEAGIYVMLELLADCELCSIGGAALATPPGCYPIEVKRRGQYIINEFSRYDNVLAFSAGNEVSLSSPDASMNAPCQKKFVRDMRAYIDSCSSTPSSMLPRKVPIGLVNWDGGATTNAPQVLYYACHTDPNDTYESIEWFGLNSYRDCDYREQTVANLTGWTALKDEFEGYNLAIPVLVAEYGCRELGFPTIGQFESQRTWVAVDALYSPEYQEVFAGGMVYEFSSEKRIADLSDQKNPWPYYKFQKLNYGVGYFSPVECNHQNISCMYEPYPEFDLLRDKFDNVDVSQIPPLNVFSLGGDGSSQASVRAQPVVGMIPTCPGDFPALSSFVWPTDQVADTVGDSDEEEAWHWSCRIANMPSSSPTSVETMAPSSSAVRPSTPTRPPTKKVPTASPITPSSPPKAPVADSTTTTSPPTTSPSTMAPASASSTAQCSDHPTCAAQNLTGACCPTSDGWTLECCSMDVSSGGNETGSVQEECSLNPVCSSSFVELTTGSCCPTIDGVWLDCCTAIDDSCQIPGQCRTMSARQYVEDLLLQSGGDDDDDDDDNSDGTIPDASNQDPTTSAATNNRPRPSLYSDLQSVYFASALVGVLLHQFAVQ